MQINVNAREYYALQITTTATSGNPIPASGWEASFDGGTTWVAATVLTINAASWSAWLIAGSKAAVGSAVAVLSQTVTPLVRATDNPEVVVDAAPKVTVYT